jgi:flagellar basal body-associated protein FliL
MFYPQIPAHDVADAPSPPSKKAFPLWALILIIAVALSVVGLVMYFAFSKPAQKFGYRFY